MGTIGSPDWQRYAARIGANLAGAVSFSVPAAGLTLGPYTVTNWGSVQLHCKPASGYGTIELDWTDTNTLIETITSQSWDVDTETDITVTVPVQAQYLQVKFTNSYGAGMDLGLTVRGAAGGGSSIAYPVSACDAWAYSVSVAASATYYVPLPHVAAGPAYLSANDPADSGKLLLSVVTLTAAKTTGKVVAYYGGMSALVNEQLVLPSERCGIRVANSDSAAAHTFSAMLSVA